MFFVCERSRKLSDSAISCVFFSKLHFVFHVLLLNKKITGKILQPVRQGFATLFFSGEKNTCVCFVLRHKLRQLRQWTLEATVVGASETLARSR